MLGPVRVPKIQKEKKLAVASGTREGPFGGPAPYFQGPGLQRWVAHVQFVYAIVETKGRELSRTEHFTLSSGGGIMP
jgi:hypothetical protein